METITRFGVSMNTELLNMFDKFIQKKGYNNRSEAIRDTIREHLVAQEWLNGDTETVGIITLVYDHESGEINEKLIESQHNYYENIITSIHIHLDRHNCLEILVIKGLPQKIQEIADHIKSYKGIKHGKLTMTTSGKKLL